MQFIAVGTFKIRGQEVVNTVLNAALTFGYRSIGTYNHIFIFYYIFLLVYKRKIITYF